MYVQIVTIDTMFYYSTLNLISLLVNWSTILGKHNLKMKISSPLWQKHTIVFARNYRYLTGNME